jgi:hypothetical protein
LRTRRYHGRAVERSRARRLDAKLNRLLDAVEPFIELLEPHFDDPAFTDEQLAGLDVHMLLVGDGELGDMPLATFRDLRDAAKAFD